MDYLGTLFWILLNLFPFDNALCLLESRWRLAHWQGLPWLSLAWSRRCCLFWKDWCQRLKHLLDWRWLESVLGYSGCGCVVAGRLEWRCSFDHWLRHSGHAQESSCLFNQSHWYGCDGISYWDSQFCWYERCCFPLSGRRLSPALWYHAHEIQRLPHHNL